MESIWPGHFFFMAQLVNLPISSSLPETKISPENRPLEIRRFLLLMEEILHQLIGSLSHYLQGFIKVLYIPGDAGFLPSTVLEIIHVQGLTAVSFRECNLSQQNPSLASAS